MAGYSKYNEGLLDGSDSQPVTSRGWFKAVLVGIPLHLLVLGIWSAASSTPATQSTSADESTNLVGLQAFRSGSLRQMGTAGAVPGLAVQGKPYGTALRVQAAQDNLQTYGITSSPLEKLALTAIDFNNQGSRARDVSAQAKIARTSDAVVASGWSLVDENTKRKLVNVLDQVKAKESVLAGTSAPLNFFDPLGFSTTVTGGKLLFYREVELKHGRVAMLASLAYLWASSSTHSLAATLMCRLTLLSSRHLWRLSGPQS